MLDLETAKSSQDPTWHFFFQVINFIYFVYKAEKTGTETLT